MNPIETVEYVAELARLKFSESEIEAFAEQFQGILSYIQTIEELDLDGVEPLTNMTEMSNVFREDEVVPSLPLHEVLMNAPKRNESFFKVPKVL